MSAALVSHTAASQWFSLHMPTAALLTYRPAILSHVVEQKQAGICLSHVIT